ncbi:MAG TPA: alpha/beta fold hydrolase [Mycobacteriales bacterium]|nr:alpha/beta fold hydrolase [Mycobacteriales bacterium]
MPVGRPAWVDAELFPFQSRFVDIDGHTVHYVDEGSGPTLLLLHGNPTWSFVYRDVIRTLRNEFRCIALDYPGFGLSTTVPSRKNSQRRHYLIAAGTTCRLPSAQSMKPAALRARLMAGAFANVAFVDAQRLVEALGFERLRVTGSHHVCARPGIPEQLN